MNIETFRKAENITKQIRKYEDIINNIKKSNEIKLSRFVYNYNGVTSVICDNEEIADKLRNLALEEYKEKINKLNQEFNSL